MKKKIAALALSVSALTACFAFAGCGNKSGEAVSYVSLDINPSIEILADKNQKVVSIKAANEDGRVLLYGEEGFVGTDIETAVGKITTLAVEYGYLDEDNKTVEAVVSSSRGDKTAQSITDKVDAKITASAQRLGLEVNVETGGAYSLLRKYNQFKAKYPNDANIQKMSVAQFKLAMSVAESGKISLEAAVGLDISELVKMADDAAKNTAEYATLAYEQAKAAAEDAYWQVAGAAVDSVYGEYYLMHAADHKNTFYYGSVYQMYSLVADGFDKTADAAEYFNKLYNSELNDEQTAAVMAALGLEESQKALIADSQGRITVASVDAYADKLFKNSDAGQEIEQIKQQLTQALNAAESEINKKLEELSKTHARQIEAIIDLAKAADNTLQTFGLALPAEAKTVIAEFNDAIGDIAAELDSGITVQNIRGCAAVMQGKADGMMQKIQKDLTKEQLAEVNNLVAEREGQFVRFKEKADLATAEAEQDAKEWLAQLKAQLKAQ